jgi:hypothetical protein
MQHYSKKNITTDDDTNSYFSEITSDKIKKLLHGDNVNHVLSEMIRRNDKKWNIENTLTIVEWLNYANIYVLYLEVYHAYCTKLLRYSTMLSLIISTITSTLSISQVSLSTASEGTTLEQMMQYGVVGTSVLTSIITGYIKIEKIEDKMEILRTHKRKWIDFMSTLINNIQCATQHRNDASKLILQEKGKFNALFSKRLNIPGFVKQRAASKITPSSSDLFDVIKYLCTCCSASKLAKRGVVRNTKNKITRYAITNQILKDELDLLKKCNPQHIKRIKYHTIHINDFLESPTLTKRMNLSARTRPTIRSGKNTRYTESITETINHRDSVVEVNDSWDPAQLLNYEIIYYENEENVVHDKLTQRILKLINISEFNRALYDSKDILFHKLLDPVYKKQLDYMEDIKIENFVNNKDNTIQPKQNNTQSLEPEHNNEFIEQFNNDDDDSLPSYDGAPIESKLMSRQAPTSPQNENDDSDDSQQNKKTSIQNSHYVDKEQNDIELNKLHRISTQYQSKLNNKQKQNISLSESIMKSFLNSTTMNMFNLPLNNINIDSSSNINNPVDISNVKYSATSQEEEESIQLNTTDK